MAKVHHVKKALKDNSAVKKGEPYWWWAFRFGGKHRSATPPRPSQLTQSEFWIAVFSVQEEIEDYEAADKEELIAAIADWVERIREAGEGCRERLDSMPYQLQESGTGELLGGRGDSCDEWADSLEQIDTDGLEAQAIYEEVSMLAYDGE
jgi:hypothetical protein